MNTATAPARSKGNSRRVDRNAERKAELAQAALNMLAEKGYARASLRDIAKASGFSLGVIHYYFKDKAELIRFCVERYKQDFIASLRAAVAEAESLASLKQGVARVLLQSLNEQPQEHRLWYDIRAQSLFDESFRPGMWAIDRQLEGLIAEMLRKMADMSGRPPRVSAGTAYAMLDGFFQRYLLRQLEQRADANDEFNWELEQVMDGLLAG